MKKQEDKQTEFTKSIEYIGIIIILSTYIP